MKKIIIVVFTMILIFAACTKIDIKMSDNNTSQPSQDPKGESVEIDGITDINSSLDNENIKVVKNDDGSFTYRIPKTTHKKMMESMREDFDNMSRQEVYKKDVASDEKGDGVEKVDDYDLFDTLASFGDDDSSIGYYDVTVTYNNDGSINYKISKATHKEILDDMEKEFEKIVEDIKDTSIMSISHDESFKEITIIVDKEKYKKTLDGFKIYSLGISSMYYQSLDGIDSDDIKVTIYVKDQKTGEVVDTIIYPDKFNQFVENCKELADGMVEFAKDTAEIFSSSYD